MSSPAGLWALLSPAPVAMITNMTRFPQLTTIHCTAFSRAAMNPRRCPFLVQVQSRPNMLNTLRQRGGLRRKSRNFGGIRVPRVWSNSGVAPANISKPFSIPPSLTPAKPHNCLPSASSTSLLSPIGNGSSACGRPPNTPFFALGTISREATRA